MSKFFKKVQEYKERESKRIILQKSAKSIPRYFVGIIDPKDYKKTKQKINKDKITKEKGLEIEIIDNGVFEENIQVQKEEDYQKVSNKIDKLKNELKQYMPHLFDLKLQKLALQQKEMSNEIASSAQRKDALFRSGSLKKRINNQVLPKKAEVDLVDENKALTQEQLSKNYYELIALGYKISSYAQLLTIIRKNEKHKYLIDKVQSMDLYHKQAFKHKNSQQIQSALSIKQEEVNKSPILKKLQREILQAEEEQKQQKQNEINYL